MAARALGQGFFTDIKTLEADNGMAVERVNELTDRHGQAILDISGRLNAAALNGQHDEFYFLVRSINVAMNSAYAKLRGQQ